MLGVEVFASYREKGEGDTLGFLISKNSWFYSASLTSVFGGRVAEVPETAAAVGSGFY